MTLIHTEIREEVEAVDREAGAVGIAVRLHRDGPSYK
jgi:hypothetical protein